MSLWSGQAPSPLSLDDALARARASRPALQAAERRLSAARKVRGAAGAAPSPTLFVGATGKGDPTGGSEDLAIVLPIDLFGRTAAARGSGDAGVALAEAEVRRVQAEVQTELLLRYVEAAAAEALLTAARNVNEISVRLLQATERRAADGAVPGVQIQRARIEADRSKRTVARREAEVRAARLRLAAAMGMGSEGFAEPIGEMPDLSSALPADGIVETPDIALRSAEVRGATADVRVAKLLGQPEFQVEARRSPFYESSNAVYARIQLSFPLFDGKRVRNERGAAEDRQLAAERALADARQQAAAALGAARIEFEAAREEVASFGPTLDAARSLVLRSEAGLIEGATTFTDTLEAVRALRDVEEGLVESRRRLGEATTELLRAGGVLLPERGDFRVAGSGRGTR